MKPLKLVTTPTRNRRLNELIGLDAGFRDPPSPRPRLLSPHRSFIQHSRWLRRRPSCAQLDRPHRRLDQRILLQLEGLTAFCLPSSRLRWVGPGWIESRGSPGAKLIGIALCMIFGPALAGLLPGHLHFMYGLPIEGLVGRLASDALVQWLNYPGACVVAVTMVAIAIYLSTTFSFNTAREWLAIRFAFIAAWRDRWINWRSTRAKKKELKAEARMEKIRAKELANARKAAAKLEKSERRNVAALAEVDEDESVGHRQRGFAEMLSDNPPQQTVWEQMPRATISDPRARARASGRTAGPRAQAATRAPPRDCATRRKARPSTRRSARRTKHRHRRAGRCRLHTTTVTPKSVSGFKLPPSTLLHRSEDSKSYERTRCAPRPRCSSRNARSSTFWPGSADQSRPGRHHL